LINFYIYPQSYSLHGFWAVCQFLFTWSCAHCLKDIFMWGRHVGILLQSLEDTIHYLPPSIFLLRNQLSDYSCFIDSHFSTTDVKISLWNLISCICFLPFCFCFLMALIILKYYLPIFLLSLWRNLFNIPNFSGNCSVLAIFFYIALLFYWIFF
jgi:hypothetical protein